jgi:copper(I)-binding protein
MKRLLAATLLAATATFAYAHHDGERFKVGDLMVSHAYMYENAATAHATRVYLTIENTGSAADRLVGASVDFATKVVFEGQAIDTEGTLAVTEVTALGIAPGQTLTLQPGAMWIELEGVHKTFEHGEHFDMTLTFEKAGTVEIEVEIEEAPDGEDHDHDHGAAS